MEALFWSFADTHRNWGHFYLPSYRFLLFTYVPFDARLSSPTGPLNGPLSVHTHTYRTMAESVRTAKDASSAAFLMIIKLINLNFRMLNLVSFLSSQASALNRVLEKVLNFLKFASKCLEDFRQNCQHIQPLNFESFSSFLSPITTSSGNDLSAVRSSAWLPSDQSLFWFQNGSNRSLGLKNFALIIATSSRFSWFQVAPLNEILWIIFGEYVIQIIQEKLVHRKKSFARKMCYNFYRMIPDGFYLLWPRLWRWPLGSL